MSIINVQNVQFLENPAPFQSAFRIEITFEALSTLEKELEFKVVYVGSAEDEKHDQELDSVLVGPVVLGRNRFVLEVSAPNPVLIPEKDLLEVTALLLQCSYKDKQFMRVGYYVHVGYTDPELRANPPAKMELPKLWRHVLADKPRVTRFQIPWDEAVTESQMFGLPDPSTITENDARAMAMEDDIDLADHKHDNAVEDAETDDFASDEDPNAEYDLETPPCTPPHHSGAGSGAGSGSGPSSGPSSGPVTRSSSRMISSVSQTRSRMPLAAGGSGMDESEY